MENEVKSEEEILLEWAGKVEEVYTSGKEVKQYCKEEGIDVKDFYRWRKLVVEAGLVSKEQAAEKRKKENRFGKIEPKNLAAPNNDSMENTGVIKMRKNGWELLVDGDVSEQILLKAVKAVDHA